MEANIDAKSITTYKIEFGTGILLGTFLCDIVWTCLGPVFGISFYQKSEKKIYIDSNNHRTRDHPKTWNVMSKGSHNGVKINATTHQK